MRRFVIGDIHGCSKALRAVLEAIDPAPQDELIFLGDYVDRGPDSRDVIQQLIQLRDRCQIVALRGNHEIMLLGVALHGLEAEPWLRSGGQATVASYGGSLEKIPADHFEFFQDLRGYYETSDSIFVHAGYQHDRAMPEQDDATTYWGHLPLPPPPPHFSGKRVFVGHTPQPGGEILDVGHLVCVDTYCFGGGYLTALNLATYDAIQADWHGHLRRAPLAALADRLSLYRQRIGGLLRDRFTSLRQQRRETASGEQESAEDSSAVEQRPTISPAGDQPSP